MLPLQTLLILAIVGYGMFRLLRVGRRPAGLPPGPSTLPIVGNLHQILTKHPHHQYKKWAEEYGPIYSLILGTKVLIVLNTDQAVKDLLDNRSSIYSSRPEFYIATIFSGGCRVGLMPYGDLWRGIHKIMHDALNLRASKSYVPYQEFESEQMLHDLLDQPEWFMDHFQRYTYSVTCSVVFGFRAPDINDEKLQQFFTGFQDFSVVVGGAYANLLDMYPIFRQLPDILLPIRQRVRKAHEVEKALYIGHWRAAKEKIKNNTAKPSFCYNLLNTQEKDRFSDELACYITGTLLEAGSETSASTMQGFVIAMILYPEVQKKAQEELDRVCGDRPPAMEDEENLPYVRCIVKESLRWMPAVPLGLPHAVIRDDEYQGYKIPKGAGITLNTWAIHNDSNRYADSGAFDPSRFANNLQTSSEAAVNPDVTQRDHFGFGAGRRFCPGVHVAERMVFLGVARTLWGFDIAAARDPATGLPRYPNRYEIAEGAVVGPLPFPADFTPRSAVHARVIRDRWAASRATLDAEGQWREVPAGMAFRPYQPADEEKQKEVV